MWRPARKIAAAINGTATATGSTHRHARITDVHAGPPATVDVLIEDTWPVPGLRYADHIDTPAVDDDVIVTTYGTGRRYVSDRLHA